MCIYFMLIRDITGVPTQNRLRNYPDYRDILYNFLFNV